MTLAWQICKKINLSVLKFHYNTRSEYCTWFTTNYNALAWGKHSKTGILVHTYDKSVMHALTLYSYCTCAASGDSRPDIQGLQLVHIIALHGHSIRWILGGGLGVQPPKTVGFLQF